MGNQKLVEGKVAWRLLASLKPTYNFGQCVVGDFNEIVTHYEKIGKRQRQENQMGSFREVLGGGVV